MTMDMTSDSTALSARLVPNNLRLLMQPKYFGHARQMMATEKMIFSWMSKLCSNYQGGHWAFYELTNGGFLMCVDSDREILVEFADNYTSTEMSIRSASITACLFAYAWMHQQTRDDRFALLYQRLIEYVRTLPEASAILSVLD